MGREDEHESPPSDAEVARLRDRVVASAAWIGLLLTLAVLTWQAGSTKAAAAAAFCAGFEVAWLLGRIDRYLAAQIDRQLGV